MPAFNSVEELKAHRAIPVNFGWVVPGRVAGMASPTSPDQLAHLRAHLGVALVINLTEVPLHRRGAAMLGELAPSVFHMPLPGTRVGASCHLLPKNNCSHVKYVCALWHRPVQYDTGA